MILVDKDKCIACGACYASFPELFKEADDNKSQVISSDYKAHDYEKGDIINICPVQAISVED